MRKSIFKYKLGSPSNLIATPHRATVLCVREQHGEPHVWMLVDEDAPNEDRTFRVFGTGQILPGTLSTMTYIGTAFCGSFVCHVFEEGR